MYSLPRLYSLPRAFGGAFLLTAIKALCAISHIMTARLTECLGITEAAQPR